MRKEMFFGASNLIFEKAEQLRNNGTPAEEQLWSYLRGSQLGVKFRRQHPAGIYVLDFYCHELRLAIEIDGSIHRLKDVKKNDTIRQQTLENLGIIFLRFTNSDVHYNLDIVIEKIKQMMDNQFKGLEGNSSTKAVNSSPLGAGGQLPLGAGGLAGGLIPAIDIIDGKCVRLTQGDYAQKKIYNEHPLEVAKMFEDAGLTRLHLVDLDGAKDGVVKNWKVLEKIATQTKLVIDFGGGIKTDKDVKVVFESGAAYATVGSIAVKDEQLFSHWLSVYGPGKFLLGADVKEEKIAIHGWLETTEIDVVDFIQKYLEKGVTQIFCTDVSKDGKLQGPSIDLYKKIIADCPGIDLIASGGVSSIRDVEELIVIGCKGIIIGKAIYEGRISLKQLKTLTGLQSPLP